MVEKPWNKEKSRIKSIKLETKKIMFPTLHARIIWKCWSMIGTRSNLVIIPETKLLSSFEFHSWYKFPVERSEYSDNMGPFSPKRLQVFHGERMERGEDFSDDEYLIRFRTQGSALTEEFGDVYVAWIDTYRRYTCTLALHRAEKRERKVSFLHLREENFGLAPWDNRFHIFFENLKKLEKRIFSKIAETKWRRILNFSILATI